MDEKVASSYTINIAPVMYFTEEYMNTHGEIPVKRITVSEQFNDSDEFRQQLIELGVTSLLPKITAISFTATGMGEGKDYKREYYYYTTEIYENKLVKCDYYTYPDIRSCEKVIGNRQYGACTYIWYNGRMNYYYSIDDGGNLITSSCRYIQYDENGEVFLDDPYIEEGAGANKIYFEGVVTDTSCDISSFFVR